MSDKDNKKVKTPAKEKMTKETKKRFLKKGSYSFALCVIAVLVVVAVNLFASQLPASLNQVDMSDLKLYSLTDETKAMLDGLEEDVVLYFITSAVGVDDILDKTLAQYESYSSHIKVKKIDPDANPLFTQNYTDATVEKGSVIAVCGDKSKVVEAIDMYEYTQNYQTGATVATGFDGEGVITSAISMLTRNDLPTMYVLTGHNELSMSSDLTNLIEKNGMAIETLSLLTSESVPENCDILFIYSPMTDISSDDLAKLQAYGEKGGNIIVSLYFSNSDMPNLSKLLSQYGVGFDYSIVLEEDSSYYAMQNPTYIVPTIQENQYTKNISGGQTFVLAPIMQPVLPLSTTSDDIKITSLLTTSGSSYAKADAMNMTTVDREAQDVSGPFSVMSAIEKKTEEGVSTMIVVGSESVFDSGVNEQVGDGNYRLILGVLSELADLEQSVAVPVKSLSYIPLTITTEQGNLWRNMSIFVIPGLFLVVGGIIWLKRRRR